MQFLFTIFLFSFLSSWSSFGIQKREISFCFCGGNQRLPNFQLMRTFQYLFICIVFSTLLQFSHYIINTRQVRPDKTANMKKGGGERNVGMQSPCLLSLHECKLPFGKDHNTRVQPPRKTMRDGENQRGKNAQWQHFGSVWKAILVLYTVNNDTS